MVNHPNGSFDATYINSHRNNKLMVLPEPSLPSGQKPDFGNGPRQRNGRPQKQHHGHQQQRHNNSNPKSVPNGLNKSQENNNNNHKNSRPQQKKKLQDQQKKKSQSKSNTQSPLSSPQVPQAPINYVQNYAYGSAPALVATPQRSVGSLPLVGGSTFMASPDPSMLSKPSFL
jgi:hypothetical protein